MRKLGVAAASAALIGTIAAVLPAGVAKADVSGVALPDPVTGVCGDVNATDCWRYTHVRDINPTPPEPFGPAPVAQGNVLQLNPASDPSMASAAWFNTPIDITGKSIEASYTAYLDSATPPAPNSNFAHGDGMAFALIQGVLPVVERGNNQPAPVPFDPDPNVTEYGAGGNGLGFSGFDTGDGGPTATGDQNVGFVLTTSSDDTDVGGDVGYNVSRGGILKGAAWQTSDPHVRQGRWYGTDPKPITPDIYGATANSRPVRVGIQIQPTATAGQWHAKMYVDGALLTESNINLPNVVYMGFTAGSNESFPQRHAVSDVSVRYGTIAPPTVTATPNPVDFGAVAVGDSVTHDVTLKNNSAIPVTLASTVTGGFSVAIPPSLGSGESVQVPITFAPQSATPVSGNVSITVTGPDGSSQTQIAITGTGSNTAPFGGARYNAVTPGRILDTRTSGGPVGPNATRSVKVTGLNGVPEGASAVVMNVTATQPTAPGYITVYPTGTLAPTASNLNFVAGQDIANLVTAKVGTNGRVDIYNFAGDTQVLFDVVGWFGASSSPASATTLSATANDGGQFVPLVPDRILDTRSGIGAAPAPLGPDSSIDLQVTGRGGVPPTGVAAVVMNLTGTNTSASGFLTAWPTGSPRQTTSNLNFTADQSVPNLAVVPVGTGGKVSIYNFDGNTDALADVVGYYTAPGVTVAGGGVFHAMVPNRFLDTRQSGGTLNSDGTLSLGITGKQGIPADAVGVVMNVTATNTSDAGFLTVFPTGAARPTTSNLNFVPGQSVPNLVMSKLGNGGAVSVYNFAGSTDVIADVVGWYGPT